MTYPYECPKCGKFTVERSIKEDALKECPTCSSLVVRIYEPLTYVAKCSGFYGKNSR